MNNVYVINDSGHDFSNAQRFGKLIYMTTGLVNKFNLTRMFRTFLRFLKHSTPDDYILHSGPTVMNIVACGVFIAMHGRLNLLIWKLEENGESQYICERLDFNNLRK